MPHQTQKHNNHMCISDWIESFSSVCFFFAEILSNSRVNDIETFGRCVDWFELTTSFLLY